MSFDGGGFGGFREDEEDLDALLSRPSAPTASTSTASPSDFLTYSAPPEDDLNFNAFADPYPQSPAAFPSSDPSPPRPSRTLSVSASSVTSSTSGGFADVAPYSPPPSARRRYSREDTPEIAFERRQSSGGASYVPPPPLSPSLQTPFGAGSPPLPPIASPTPFQPTILDDSPFSPKSQQPSFYSEPPPPRQPSPPPPAPALDLSTLLGEEKPILPSFSKKKPKDMGVFGDSQRAKEREVEAVLPVGTVGRVGGKKGKTALAALFGLEDDSSTSPSSPLEPSKSLKSAREVTEPIEAGKDQPAPSANPSPSASTAATSATVTKDSTPQPDATSLEPTAVPLPESRPISPATSGPPSPSLPSQQQRSDDFEVEDEGDEEDDGPATSDAAYATVVSPLYTGESEGGRSLFGAPSPALTSYAGSSMPPSSFTPAVDGPVTTSESIKDREQTSSSGEYRTSSPSLAPAARRDENVSDADSLRGTYSRSIEVSLDEGSGFADERAETDTIVASTLPTSPPLPSLPAASPALSTVSNWTTSTAAPSTAAAPPPAFKPSFTITVGDPQKVGSTLNVATQHTVYTVRTQTTSSAFRKQDFSVLRRFSHFLWLFDALTLNNPGVIVPGMPEKNAFSRFGSEFVENRRAALQATLTKIVAHPMLVGDPDLRLFLESDNLGIDIKQRKIVGVLGPADPKSFLASLGSAVAGPKFTEFDEFFDHRRETLDTLETQLRALLTSLASASKLRSALQQSLSELETALFGLAQCDLSASLRKLLERSAAVQRRVRELMEMQELGEVKGEGLVGTAESYARLCGSVKLVFGARIKAFHAWQAAEANLKKAKAAHDKAKKTGRVHSELLSMSVAEVSDAERKVLDTKADFEDVSKLTKAEMARFDKEKVDDFKKAVCDYVDGLVIRQREIVALWSSYNEMLEEAMDQQSGRLGGQKQIAGPPPESASTNGSIPVA